MTVTETRAFGGQTMTAPLRRVLVRPPAQEALAAWGAYGWRGEPNAARIAGEHEAFCSVLADAGAEVVAAEPDHGNPDAIYVFDSAIVCDRGAILLRPGKEGRRGEVAHMRADLARAGVPVAAELDEPGLAEGGDTLWLDERTLLVGRSFRTDEAGIAALRRAMPEVYVLAFDLPYLHGRAEVLHLLSLISPLDRDLVLAHLPLLPVALVQLLEDRGVGIVELPPHEFETLGCNVLALAPRRVLALEGNVQTRRRLEAAGVDVRTYRGDELSRKGDGGPTCLTRPLLRSD